MNKRDMFYSNYNAGGFIDQPMPINQNFMPNLMMPNMMMPNQMMQNSPLPNQMYNQNMMYPQMDNQTYDYDIDDRLTKLERQVRNLDTRISKLEQVKEEDITYNTTII